jgi:hypothetical protein
MKVFLSPREFSKIVNRDPKTVISWIDKRWIPGAKRVGHRYQIPVKEIEVYQSSPHYPPRKWQKS